MTFTIDTGFLSNASQLGSPGALLGMGIVFIFLWLAWNLAKWGDQTNGRPQQYSDKQGMSLILICIIVIAIVSVAFAGNGGGYTTLTPASGTPIWGR